MTILPTSAPAPAASASARPIDWPTALAVLRDAGARIHRLGPDTSLPEALLLIAETAVRLVALRADDSRPRQRRHLHLRRGPRGL